VDDPVVVENGYSLTVFLQAYHGLEVQTTIAQAEVVPGEKMQLHHSVVIHSGIPVRWIAVRYPAIKNEIDQEDEILATDPNRWTQTQTLPADTPLSQPQLRNRDARFRENAIL